jgi:hypothetical protein
MLKNNNIMNSINTVGSAANSMMQSCANSVLSGCPVSSSMKAPGIDSPCMMPGSPTGHHSPSNPAMMPGGAPDIAGSPVSGPQPTLTGERIAFDSCMSMKLSPS